MNGHDATPSLFRLEKIAWVVGIAGVALTAFAATLDLEQFFRSYLVAFIFVFATAIGCLGILMLQYVTGGYWGILIRRILEAGTRTLPLIALLFVPILFGIHELYVWSHEDVLATDALVQAKSVYLNSGGFILRAVIYFLIWLSLGFFTIRWTDQYEDDPSPAYLVRLRRLSAFGIIAIVFTTTFASIDWMMSIEPHWFSTMYGISFAVGAALSGFAFAIIALVLLSNAPPFAGLLVPVNFRDLGNLLLASVMMWAYTAFSEFMLIWYGNLREEVPWYLVRIHGGWGVVAALLIVFHFFLPFTLLLMRGVKDRAKALAIVAVLVLVFRAVDVWWLLAPGFGGHGEEDAAAGFHFSWVDPVATIGLFSLWVAVVIGRLRKRPLLPAHEPLLEEAVSHG
jgi:hypothetical protein